MSDSERFYNTVLDLFDDVEELTEVNDLMTWWNRYAISFVLFYFGHSSCFYSQIFPNYSSARHAICKTSALARIKQKRSELRDLAVNT